MLHYFEALVNFLWGLPIIVIILGTGAYFTIKTGFFQVVHLKHIFSETIFKIIKKGNKAEGEGKGLITPFEAVATAIGGSVGVGNIVELLLLWLLEDLVLYSGYGLLPLLE